MGESEKSANHKNHSSDDYALTLTLFQRERGR